MKIKKVLSLIVAFCMVLSMTFISAYADNEFSMSANNIEFSTSQIYVDGHGIELPYLQYEIVNPITNASASDSVSIENVTSIKATLIPESKERALSLLNPNTSNSIVSELCDVSKVWYRRRTRVELLFLLLMVLYGIIALLIT